MGQRARAFRRTGSDKARAQRVTSDLCPTVAYPPQHREHPSCPAMTAARPEKNTAELMRRIISSTDRCRSATAQQDELRRSTKADRPTDRRGTSLHSFREANKTASIQQDWPNSIVGRCYISFMASS